MEFVSKYWWALIALGVSICALGYYWDVVGVTF
jgi:hypothetical protein